MKNAINNSRGCTTPWAAFHPVLRSCSVWQPRSHPGPAGSMTQAGITEGLRKSKSLSSFSKTLIFPVCCFLSVRGRDAALLQPTQQSVFAEQALLQTRAGEEDEMMWHPKSAGLSWPSSKIPMNKRRSITAKTLVAMPAEEQQHCTFCSSAASSGMFWNTYWWLSQTI